MRQVLTSKEFLIGVAVGLVLPYAYSRVRLAIATRSAGGTPVTQAA